MTVINFKGLLYAAILFLCWLCSLVVLLQSPARGMPIWLVISAVLVRTVLQTALFITAHDAMHELLIPGMQRWNHRIGAFALAIYGGLSYQQCRHKHRLHHRHTASRHDPDFTKNLTGGIAGWYLNFMGNYLSASQFISLLSLWGLWITIGSASNHAAWMNVLLFCTLPLLLSSIQLFIFGTYLPHRNQRDPLNQRDPESLALPTWLSLLACFHFGYHREHHEHPDLPWYELPAQRQLSQRLAASQ